MNLTGILPYEKYVLVSQLTPAEIGRRIDANVSPKNTSFSLWYIRNPSKPYQGEYVGDRFRISRIIAYRNSFLPTISGHIIPFGTQTKIAITMQLSPFVLVFMAAWLSIVGWACLAVLRSESEPFEKLFQESLSSWSLLPFGMFIFGCLLTIIPFKIESWQSKKFLAHLFEGQEVTE